ncbi:MAG: hypothetical protein AAF512_14685, partial [Pseudomonadota bacterium]
MADIFISSTLHHSGFSFKNPCPHAIEFHSSSEFMLPTQGQYDRASLKRIQKSLNPFVMINAIYTWQLPFNNLHGSTRHEISAISLFCAALSDI